MKVDTFMGSNRPNAIVHQGNHAKGTQIGIVSYLFQLDPIVKDATGVDPARALGGFEILNSTFHIKKAGRFRQILGDIVSSFRRLANRFDKTTSITTGDLDPGAQ